jgi:type I restriction-modification system DNA methylase subunit
MLNPPFKTDRNDTEELEFVLNNLEGLKPNGICLAILPMQCALAQKGAKLFLKERLLKNHTLEAVLSLPNELFHNSKVGVVTCAMIVTAHQPHPKNKETYFGYYKDDGFIKRKGRGRIDDLLLWKDKKEEWVFHYANRKEKAGLSVNKIITANNEWCAEAYMETDYKDLVESDFEDTVRRYVSFLINEGL